MKTYRILALTAVALLSFAACTQQLKTAVTADEGVIPMEGGLDASLTYSYSMEYVTGGVPRPVMDMINSTIIDSNVLYETEERTTDVPAACERWAESLVEGYKSDTAEFADEFDEEEAWMFNWSSDIDGKFESGCKARNWMSYCTSASDYTGGAHGMFAMNYTVFDMKTGEVVREEDFLDLENEELSDLIYDKVLEGIDEDMWDSIYETPTPNGNFRVDDEGVCWIYNPYEIGPYVLGVLDAFVSWEELAPFLLAR